MAKAKTIEELKKEQKTLADLIRKKEREIEDLALKKVANYFMVSLSRMIPEKMEIHINNIQLNADELDFIERGINRLKEKKNEDEQNTPPSPTAPPEKVYNGYNT